MLAMGRRDPPPRRGAAGAPGPADLAMSILKDEGEDPKLIGEIVPGARGVLGV